MYHDFVSVEKFSPFGCDSAKVTEYTEPVRGTDLQKFCGKGHGIQGHKNSCYLDATLFAMFAGSDAFDGLLLRPENKSRDVEQYSKIQECLKNEIVYPLRTHFYVRADHVFRLREILSRALPHVSGLTEEEKDPEEFLTDFLGILLRCQPDILLTSGESSYLCQLILDEQFCNAGSIVTVQNLLEKSFFHSNIGLKRIPARFIVQLPRYGKKKLYKWIIPNLRLDISNVLDKNPKKCFSCDNTSTVQCPECYLVGASSLGETFFCLTCFEKYHASLNKESDHLCKSIEKIADGAHNRAKVTLELSAVLCIESSHYVAFSRLGRGQDEKWVFFDSMADREGLENGYNIPNVLECDDISRWLISDNVYRLIRKLEDEGSVNSLSPHLNRLLNDCYICFYVWPEGMLYG